MERQKSESKHDRSSHQNCYWDIYNLVQKTNICIEKKSDFLSKNSDFLQKALKAFYSPGKTRAVVESGEEVSKSDKRTKRTPSFSK